MPASLTIVKTPTTIVIVWPVTTGLVRSAPVVAPRAVTAKDGIIVPAAAGEISTKTSTILVELTAIAWVTAKLLTRATEPMTKGDSEILRLERLARTPVAILTS